MDEGKIPSFFHSCYRPTGYPDYTANWDNISNWSKKATFQVPVPPGPNVINWGVNGRLEFQLHDQNGCRWTADCVFVANCDQQNGKTSWCTCPAVPAFQDATGLWKFILGNAERRANGSHMTPVYKMTGSNTPGKP